MASGLGLGSMLPGVLRARAVRLDVGRHFAKPVQRGACLAMNLEPLARATVSATPLDLSRDPVAPGGCEALLVEVDPSYGELVARREGFPPSCWATLAGLGPPLAVTLRELAALAGDDVLGYRAQLLARAGFAGERTHYVPHPVDVAGEPPALVFVAPGPGRTGREGLPSALETVDLAPARLAGLPASFARAYPAADSSSQQRYVGLCLLAAAHGLCVADLLDGPPTAFVADVLAGWRDRAALSADRELLQLEAGCDLEPALLRSGLRLS
ncbi:MAG: hypothetical protein KDD82_04975 [Planctomycetes bacterium]|nr:hypothetical protein [Planctomycetota bacterium]